MSLQLGSYAGREVFVFLRQGTDSSKSFGGTYSSGICLDKETLFCLLQRRPLQLADLVHDA